MLLANGELGFGDTEYLIPYVTTIIIIITKISLGVYLYRREKKNENKNYFIRGACFMMFMLAISRIFYFIFDFYLTKFDNSLYYISPNIWIWKVGNFLSAISAAYLLYVIDKKVMQFKFKGSFAYIVFIVSMVQFFYPVNDAQSFETASTIGVFSMAFGLILPITFFYVGLKSSGELRKISFLLTFAIILYALGGQLVNESFLIAIGASQGSSLRIAIFVIVPLLKIISLAIIAYSSTKFRY